MLRTVAPAVWALCLAACGGGGGGGGEVPPQAPNVLTVTVSGSGVVRSNPAGIDCGSDCRELFDAASRIVLTATPASGQTFSSWSGDCSGTAASCTVAMDRARNVTASFAATQTPQFALTVTLVGAGSVRSDPAGIDCGSTCTANFGAGTTITLVATPGTGQRFAGWSGACSGSTVTCSVVTSAARAVTASFEAAPVAAQWGAPQLLESSNDFNVSDTSPFAEPSVFTAISSAGHAMVLWEQSDGVPNGSTRKVFSRLYVPNQGWAAAVVVPGLSTSSSLTAPVEGKLLLSADGVATWLRPNLETRRFSAAAGWGAPFYPPTQSGGTLTAAVIDGSGAVGVLISGSDVYNNALLPQGGWGKWARVDASGNLTARDADVALSADGTALAIWREANPGDTRYSLKAARYTLATGWQPPQGIESGLDEVIAQSRPRVAMDAAGNGLAFWHQGTSMYYALFSPSTGWGAPTAIDAGNVNAGFSASPRLAMNSDGRAVMSWASGLFTLKTARYIPGAGVSVPESVATNATGVELGLDDGGNATLLYVLPEGPAALGSLYGRRFQWGQPWTAAAAIEAAAGDIKNSLAAGFNRAGQGVVVWVQDDAPDTQVRNSLWASVLR